MTRVKRSIIGRSATCALIVFSLSATTALANESFRNAFINGMHMDVRTTPAKLWVNFDRNDGTGEQSCVGDSTSMNVDNAAITLMASVTRKEFTRNKVFIVCDSRANGARLLSVTYKPNI